mmetsp:Transcript_29876/g.96404  ORF Transcript_29876/g.96404 Transcript_29876/m.96404 type:complete len:243 (+) Transcript_29876:127-855(+)
MVLMMPRGLPQASMSKGVLEEESKSQEPIDAQVVPEGDVELGAMSPTALPVANVQQEAVPLTPRAAAQVEQDVPLATVANVPGIVVERIKERPRQCCAGFGCFVVLVTFLIAFLFIPRAPNVRLSRVDGLLDGLVVASVKFDSRTLVEAKWDKLELDLEWSRENLGIVDIATLSRDKSFTTKAFGTKDVDLDETDDVQANNRQLLANFCATEDDATLRVRGHIRTDNTRFRIESQWRRTTCQ